MTGELSGELLPRFPSRQVTFPARSYDGVACEQTGLMHLPASPAPAGGYPVVVYGHMTTGGCAAAAPSAVALSTDAPSHVEWRRMSQGDELCGRLLERGIAVLRPDYEGIGSAGTHPYLIGLSLAESMLAIMRARGSFDAELGDRFVLAGHSEGAVAAMHASVSAREPEDNAVLLGTAAFAPVTRMERSIGAARHLGKWFPGYATVSALIGLMLSGAAVEDERLAELLAGDGLSEQARAVWPHLGERTLNELIREDSWGGVAPREIAGAGAAGAELWQLLFASFRRNEVADLVPGESQPPLRIDAAMFDEVAPAPFTRSLVRSLRGAGWNVTSKWWPTHHSGTMHAKHAPSQAAAWIAHCF